MHRSGALLRELFTGLDGPLATARRLHLVAWLRLLVAFPLIVVPAGLGYYTTSIEPGDYQTTRAVLTAWTVAHAITLAINVAVVLACRGFHRHEPSQHRARVARMLTYAMLIGDLAANQIGCHAMGALAGPASVFVLLIVICYRVSLDWYIGLAGAIAGSLLFATGAAIEITGVVPPQPLLSTPNPIYGQVDTAVSMTLVFIASIWVTFIALNHALNQSLKLHRYITEAVLRRYLPAGLVERAGRGELRLDDAPERRVVTVLFTDLVGFTALAEQLGAETVGRVLSRYFSETAAVAHAHGAFVDKFIGDASMIVLGAPDPLDPPEQARRALRIARELHSRLADLLPDQPLQARTGINTGEAVVGNFGSAQRSDYTAVGPAVNLAARLENAAGSGQILVGPETARLLGDAAPLEELPALSLKGIGSTRAFRAA